MIDLVAFTSALQATNLFAVARHEGKEASLKQSLGRTLVASMDVSMSESYDSL